MHSPRIPILMYHKIDACPAGAKVPHHYVHPARFSAHLRALTSFGFQTTTLSGAVSMLNGNLAQTKKPIVLTFDDGYENFVSKAVPAMLNTKATGTVFVVTGQFGGTNAWDTALGDVPESLMTAEDIVKVAAMGFEIGSHSVNHARLATVAPEVAHREIVDSKRAIGTLLGKEPDVFCYPYGSYTDDVLHAVEQAGYSAACSVEKGWNDANTDRFRMKRVNVRRDTSSPILFWKLWSQGRIRPRN